MKIIVDRESESGNIYQPIFAVGVAVAIAPPEQTPVPVGMPKTGFKTVRMAKTAAALFVLWRWEIPLL